MRHRLNPKSIASLPAGRHSDGGGLYLLIRQRAETLEKLWVYRYRKGGRDGAIERSISLGPLRDVSLAKAREKAALCREEVRAGRDPKTSLVSPDNSTFGKVADDLVDSLTNSFKNEKHREQWKTTLSDTYCKTLRKRPINGITTEHVLEVLKPIWQKTPETASRLRGRIERVLDAAKVQSLREGDNPARWKGHLDMLLPKPAKLRRGHHAALPWKDMPGFMMDLRSLDSITALSLEWTILTACRTGEAVNADRSEINRETRVWTIPARRMKAKREHRVPLSDRCMAILAETDKIGGKWLFPGLSIKKPLSTSAMAECLKHLAPGVTVHGFRSSFRDWVSEATQFPEWLAEAALAHVIADKTERAYKRTDALERRLEMMQAWERYCRDTPAKVVNLRAVR